jgi:predicted ArsR family transcriptional regulator
MSEPGGDLSPELRAFLYSCIDAVEQVELLAVVSQSGRSWTAHAVGQALGVTDTVARHHLETLAARGLLQITVGAELSYSYAPKTGELRRYADQLVERYATSRTAVLRFITSNPRRLKQFSDAFKLRDEE